MGILKSDVKIWKTINTKQIINNKIEIKYQIEHKVVNSYPSCVVTEGQRDTVYPDLAFEGCVQITRP